MPTLRIATWNINSVRLRRPLLGELVKALEPDVLCLQETKCPDELFPLEDIRAFGFAHIAHRGMKGYNGVAILSRLPFELREGEPDWCGRGDCRHISVALDAPGGPVELHDFYVPAGGDLPDREANPKFAHKLDFVAEAAAWSKARGAKPRSVLVGDLNIAPLEHDVWSHRQMLGVVSHTPVEVEALTGWMRAGEWHDALRHFVPAEEKLYTWWSYRARDWEAADRGRRLDHVWVSPDLAGKLARHVVLKPARGWPQASDHVPAMVELAL
ncbi:exodeoxyribonuclease III [Paracraurococcus lichenis]|uniref:Exodeoxyribonuclease III n=1 Tax=Paracraurococcus lichenis TaxID=3064888 RepID=A0ABT9E125_9PROT|nr:exodeoxyribonuclease III [Paracraurococcus sp. LOR1-02]MDO9709846.1 exodeoxyribonuclease III [Paracraurococcus sp. LOR1-02]